MKQISDKKRKMLEEAGLPIHTFSKVGGSKKQPMKPKSDKRACEDTKYKLACIQAEMDNIKKYGELTCEFCRMPMYEGRPEHHHVAGRDGDLFTNAKGLWVCHGTCHSIGHSCYHALPLSKQVSQPWFPRLLEAIKVVDEEKFLLTRGKAEEFGYKHLI